MAPAPQTLSADRRASRPALLVVVAAIAFSFAGPAAKVALAAAHPLAIAAGRCIVASLAVALFARGAIPAALAKLDGRARGRVVLAGAVLAAHFALYIGGLGATSFTAAVVLVALEPIAVLAAGFVGFGLSPTRVERLGVAVAAVGAMGLALGAGSAGEHRVFGDLLVLGAVAVYGVYVGLARALASSLPALVYAAAVYAVAGVILSVASVAVGAPLVPHDARTAIAVVVLGLVPTLVGHTLVQIASRSLRPSYAALVSPGESVGSVAIGALAMGLWPSHVEWLAGAVVLVGATVTVLGARDA